jgi:hypothetical protein
MILTVVQNLRVQQIHEFLLIISMDLNAFEIEWKIVIRNI